MGRITSVAWLAPLDRYVGLGLVRREADLARPVKAGGAEATIGELPLRLPG
ncbi:hypothetical protein D3C83_227950 [compost metagenome]